MSGWSRNHIYGKRTIRSCGNGIGKRYAVRVDLCDMVAVFPAVARDPAPPQIVRRHWDWEGIWCTLCEPEVLEQLIYDTARLCEDSGRG